MPETVIYMGSYAFGYTTKLSTMTFAGTKAQWEAMEKNAYWNALSALTSISCSDGTVYL